MADKHCRIFEMNRMSRPSNDDHLNIGYLFHHLVIDADKLAVIMARANGDDTGGHAGASCRRNGRVWEEIGRGHCVNSVGGDRHMLLNDD